MLTFLLAKLFSALKQQTKAADLMLNVASHILRPLTQTDCILINACFLPAAGHPPVSQRLSWTRNKAFPFTFPGRSLGYIYRLKQSDPAPNAPSVIRPI